MLWCLFGTSSMWLLRETLHEAFNQVTDKLTEVYAVDPR